MVILGIDGGMLRLGLGTVKERKDELELVSHGLIHNPRTEQTFNAYLNDSIEQITIDFPRFLNVVSPNLIVSEYIPPGKLGSNDSLVIAAVTTCKVIAFQFGIQWRDIAAVTVKKELTGNHKATKTQIRNTIFALYPTVEERHLSLKKEQKEQGEKAIGLPFDVTDALAIATVGARKYGSSLREVRQDKESDPIQLKA